MLEFVHQLIMVVDPYPLSHGPCNEKNEKPKKIKDKLPNYFIDHVNMCCYLTCDMWCVN